MSTSDWLAKMDIEQLRFARDEAARRIKAIEDEERVKLYIVEGPNINEACFHEHEFGKAKEKLAEVILSDRFKETHSGADHPRIRRISVYESEVAGYMDLNS